MQLLNSPSSLSDDFPGWHNMSTKRIAWSGFKDCFVRRCWRQISSGIHSKKSSRQVDIYRVVTGMRGVMRFAHRFTHSGVFVDCWWLGIGNTVCKIATYFIACSRWRPRLACKQDKSLGAVHHEPH